MSVSGEGDSTSKLLHPPLPLLLTPVLRTPVEVTGKKCTTGIFAFGEVAMDFVCNEEQPAETIPLAPLQVKPLTLGT